MEISLSNLVKLYLLHCCLVDEVFDHAPLVFDGYGVEFVFVHGISESFYCVVMPSTVLCPLEQPK